MSSNIFLILATFHLLQSGFTLPAKDVGAAVNLCEELVPLEIDLTEYLLSVCGHARSVYEAAYIEQMRMEDLQRTMPSVDFDILEGSVEQNGMSLL